jgi:glycine betaine/proline transport system substrate-binding protein
LTIVSPRRVLALLVALWGFGLAAGPVAAQDVPPLETPDVTVLVAPSGPSSGDVLPDPEASAADSAAAAAPVAAPDVEAPPCGMQTITIARMSWPSAALLAEIHARSLKAQFNCTVQVIPSDLAPAVAGMVAAGQPAVAPEMWLARVADQWNQAVKDQKLRQVGLSYTASQLEGWYVPDYVASAHPELKSATALKDDWQLFAKPGAKKGIFVSCPADWACALINRNLLRALGLDGLFDVVEPKNRFDLDQTIGAAVNRREPILFYYWQPHATLAQFGFRPVDLGPYSKDDFLCLGKRSCAAPKPSSFAPEPVVIALAQWVFTGAPEIAAYFQRAQMPMDEMNRLLDQLNQPGATVEGVADKFVAERQDVWQKWLGTPLPAVAPGADGSAPAAGKPLTPRPAQSPIKTLPEPARPAPAINAAPPRSLTEGGMN